jgi:hypothetical protein
MTVMDPKAVVRRAGALVVLTGGLVAVLSGGVAFAYWVTGGSGTGSATAGSSVPLTAVGSTSGLTALYPGGTGSVKVVVTNPNPFPVTVTAVSGSGAITSDKGSACNASTGVTFTTQSGSWGPIAGSGGTLTITLPGAVAMSNASDNTCQGAVFTIPVTLAGASS